MTLSLDQKKFIYVCCCLLCTLIIAAYTLQILFLRHTQRQQDLEKNIRIKTLQRITAETPQENIPSYNALDHLKRCGEEYIVRITQDKDLSCELNCSYQQLLTFLQSYAAAPEYIQTIHIIRDKQLLVTMTLRGISGMEGAEL